MNLVSCEISNIFIQSCKHTEELSGLNKIIYNPFHILVPSLKICESTHSTFSSFISFQRLIQLLDAQSSPLLMQITLCLSHFIIKKASIHDLKWLWNVDIRLSDIHIIPLGKIVLAYITHKMPISKVVEQHLIWWKGKAWIREPNPHWKENKNIPINDVQN